MKQRRVVDIEGDPNDPNSKDIEVGRWEKLMNDVAKV